MFQVADTVQCTHGIIKYSVWSIKRFINQILFKCMLWKFLIKSSLFKSFIFLSGGIASQWELTLPPNLIVWRRKNLFNCPLSKSWLFKLIFLARQRLFTLPFLIKVPTILYIKAKSMFKTFLRSNLFHLKLSSGKKYLRFSKLIFVKNKTNIAINISEAKNPGSFSRANISINISEAKNPGALSRANISRNIFEVKKSRALV